MLASLTLFCFRTVQVQLCHMQAGCVEDSQLQLNPTNISMSLMLHDSQHWPKPSPLHMQAQLRQVALHQAKHGMLNWRWSKSVCPLALQEAEQEFVAKVEAALQANEVDEDQLIEERRKRRQQILAKHQQEEAALPGTSAQTVRLCCFWVCS